MGACQAEELGLLRSPSPASAAPTEGVACCWKMGIICECGGGCCRDLIVRGSNQVI